MEIAPILHEISESLVSQRGFPTATCILMSLLFESIHVRKAQHVRVRFSSSPPELQMEDDGEALGVDEMQSLWKQLCGVAELELDTWDNSQTRSLRNGWITSSNSEARRGSQIRVFDLFAKLPVRRLQMGQQGMEETELLRALERLVLLAPSCTVEVCLLGAAVPLFSHVACLSTRGAFARLFGEAKASGLGEFAHAGFRLLMSATQQDLHHSKELQFVFALGRLDFEWEHELKHMINSCFKERSKINFVQLTSVQKRTLFPVFVVCLEDEEMLVWSGRKNLKRLAESILDSANWTRQRFDEERACAASPSEWATSQCFCHPASASQALAKYANAATGLKPLGPAMLHSKEPVKLTREMLQTSRVVGQVSDEFIILRLESNGALWCVDQHAADERVRFERFQADLLALHRTGSFPSRKQAAVLGITPTERCKLDRHRDWCESWGYEYKVSSNSVEVEALPIVLGVGLGASTLLEMVAEGGGVGCPLPFRRALASKACRGAIMFGTQLSEQQCAQLVGELSQCLLPFQCAHGRPSVAPFKVQL
ncbi:hypothetical protein BASA81_008689 [Batrachochytrium salamandrivorans]|nr:hypothetical protein BASA81_008689 [Batrachochytrium salamandrivorans]